VRRLQWHASESLEMNRGVLTGVLAAIVLLGGLHGAQAGVDVWTTTGPCHCTVVGLAVDPGTPTTLYASAYGQGLFKSTDGGGSWVNIAGTVGVLAIDPQTPTTLYAGTDGDGNSVYVLKSTDGGTTWSRHNIAQTISNVFLINRVRALAIDPLTPTTLYASTAGRGIFKSTDGGESWSAIIRSSSGVALGVDPQTPTTLYAGLSTNTTGQILKSTDGGATWSDINNDLGVGTVAIDPQTTSTLYVGGVDHRTGSRGAFKSTDGGVSWRAINNGLPNFPVIAFAIDPQTTTTLYASGWDWRTESGGVFKSTDGGESWSGLNAGLPNLQVRALIIDPQTPTTLYAGASGGVFTLQQTTGSGAVTTTVNFDTPAPPGHPGPLDGVFEGIDFGTGQWAWEGPFNVAPTNHVYFANSTGTSRSFAFSPGPRVLDSLSVFSPTPGTLTLTDDAGQTLTREVTTGSMQGVTTGWSRPSTTVTVSFTNGWDLGIDDITSRPAPQDRGTPHLLHPSSQQAGRWRTSALIFRGISWPSRASRTRRPPSTMTWPRRIVVTGQPWTCQPSQGL
jgi:photosystem II stability/assembly factor-like uncharacterized protein